MPSNFLRDYSRNVNKTASSLETNRFAFKCYLPNLYLAITLNKSKLLGLKCQCAKGTTVCNGSHPEKLKSPGKLRKYYIWDVAWILEFVENFPG